ncbi:MAG TPA: response regulator transcription factor [Mesorhizobium sp.]|jgi:FixJ family two-component response regulator|uniref:response regulator transcription factor n=1 Tax=Mesorhizobium sp. TaxID=1871066 RepID=UPI002DDD629D|nr:response regulator transcription factor [Mesorhizobium sp.]HEV2507664.1 response regulator transcription factor [Mesorhizobium sp.]
MNGQSSGHLDEEPIVYIVDDDRSVRESLEDLLASVALRARSFGSVQDFLNTDLAEAPSCLVLDVRMPGQSGMDFLSHMTGLGLHLPTIMVTGHGDIAMGVKAMKDGAIEFLTKPFRDQDLLDAIQRGIEIDKTRRLREVTEAELQQRWKTLSPGEQDVARLVVQGLLNKQIAAELKVSEITVKVRRSHLMRKMGTRTLADLVRMFDRIHTA